MERKALLIAAIVYLTMGTYGWITYYLSGSEAVLLDGNYDLITGFASLAGFFIVKMKNKKTKTFPYGKFVFESLYSLIKGILVFVLLVIALSENAIKIINYFNKGIIHEISTGPIAVYTLVMIISCFSLAFYLKRQNKKLGYNSSMLKTDSKTAIIDGFLSAFAGGGLLLFVYIGSRIPSLYFLQYIGDSIVVIVFALLTLKEPFQIIKTNFIEMAGGQLQAKEKYAEIKETIKNNLDESMVITNTYINKTGSLFFILVYVSGKYITGKKLLENREIIQNKLKEKNPELRIELVIS